MSTRKSKARIPLGIRFSVQQIDRLKQIAQQGQEQTFSDVVRLAVDKYLAELENPPRAS